MTQCSVGKHEDAGSNPSYPDKKLGMDADPFNFNPAWGQTQEDH